MERRRYDELAAEEQRRYLQECTDERVARMQSGADADDDGDNNADADDGDEGEGPAVSDELLALQLPIGRVTRVIRNNKDVGKVSREGAFCIAKARAPTRAAWPPDRLRSSLPQLFPRSDPHATCATCQSAEAFLSRCVWDSARVTSRHSRKTLMLRDFMSALHEHPNPEAVQVCQPVSRYRPLPWGIGV